MTRVIQLDIFNQLYPPPIRRYYIDLNIHERINVKANSMGFATTYLRMLRKCWCHEHHIRRDEHPEELTQQYFHWYRMNNISIETIVWRKKVLKANSEPKIF